MYVATEPDFSRGIFVKVRPSLNTKSSFALANTSFSAVKGASKVTINVISLIDFTLVI
ncbi:hypothetical protein D3C71_1979150 [compost metagenome]